MSLSFDLESIHEQNLKDISENFGEEAKRLYQQEREKLEKKSTIQDFIPILLYNKIK